MTNIIKQIKNIIGNHWSSKIRIDIWTDEFCIYIYESEIPIVVNLKDKTVYVDCDTMNHRLTGDMLDELSRIVKLLEDNMEVVLDCLVIN